VWALGRTGKRFVLCLARAKDVSAACQCTCTGIGLAVGTHLDILQAVQQFLDFLVLS
jgi:hypothetical protein